MAAISDQAILKPENKFKYNGKELQHKEFSDGTGLEEYDYTKRFYDPQIGRFISIDHLADKFAYLTPYQYASNNPILNVDLDGLEGVQYDQVIKRNNGKSKTITNVDVDVYVGVGSGPNTFKSSDVSTIQSNLEDQYNGFKVNGKEVDFHFNMGTYNADQTSVTDEATKLKETTTVQTSTPSGLVDQKTGKSIPKQSIMGVAMGLDNKLDNSTQGNTVVNGSSINPNADDISHTEAHEMGHFLMLDSPENPSTPEQHNEIGGIFQLEKKDPDGNIIQNTENVNLKNIQDILKYIPKK